MGGAIAYYVRYKQISFEDKKMFCERDDHVRDIYSNISESLGVSDINNEIL